MGCTPWRVWGGPVSIPLAHKQIRDLSLQPNYRIGDPILHIELRRWADIVLIAPCSANTLAKIATGVCDNLVVSQSSPPLSSSHFRAHSYISSRLVSSRHINMT